MAGESEPRRPSRSDSAAPRGSPRTKKVQLYSAAEHLRPGGFTSQFTSSWRDTRMGSGEERKRRLKRLKEALRLKEQRLAGVRKASYSLLFAAR